MVSDKSMDPARRTRSFLKVWVVTVLFCFTIEVLSPAAQAVANQLQAREVAAPVRSTAGERTFGKALSEAKEHLRVLAGHPDALKRRSTPAQRSAHRAALRKLRDELRAFDQSTQADFDATARLIDAKGMTDVIRQRHSVAAAKFRSEMDGLGTDLDAALGAADDATARTRAESAFVRLDRALLEHHQANVDPRHLPNRILKADPNRRPRETVKDFRAAGLTDQAPRMLFVALNPFSISNFPSAADPAYLAPTTEVVLGPNIVAKASALNGNPVAIYNWVRNNVLWQPTWGAIQDASQTLATQQGNAFDIASLMIALLRASGIPARYVHGTVDMAPDDFRNWAGGFQTAIAAQNFVSAGGVPVTAITAGGQIVKIRMEHVWVEAAVDFVPSRGAVNKSADSWVALDPSLKQVQVLTGIDVASVSGIDATTLGNNFLNSATVNQMDHWVSGFNPTILQTGEAQGLTNVQNYITANLPNGTVGDVLGGRIIVAQNSPVLPASLPTKLVVVGARYAALPAVLEQQMTFALGTDVDGTPLNPITLPWPSLNNRRITLSFVPSTAADAVALQALLPQAPTTLSQFPFTLPAYLFHVTPQLTLENQVIATGSPMSLGDELGFVFTPTLVDRGDSPNTYQVVAGSYLAVAVIAGTVSPAEIAATQARLATTSTALQSTDPAVVAELTRDTVIGEQFHVGVLSYYGQYLGLAQAMGRRQGLYHELAAGVGTFGSEPTVDYVFGIPRAITPGSVVMNIPIISIFGTDGMTTASEPMFAREVGTVSSLLESSVPEETLGVSLTTSPGISAVRAITMALAQGQRVYSVTATNLSTVLSQVALNAPAIDDVNNAVAAGQEVVVHSGTVSVPGWTGVGYIIRDPVTGDGAYKISGGANGSSKAMVDNLMTLVAGILGFVDGNIGRYKDGSYIFSDTLIRLQSLAKSSFIVGIVALIQSLSSILTNDKLSGSQQLGQVSLEFLGFGLSAYVGGVIAGLTIAGGALALPVVLGVALTVVTSVLFSIAIQMLEELYFTFLRRREKAWPVYV
jgi:Transglutaminase-like superfamily